MMSYKNAELLAQSRVFILQELPHLLPHSYFYTAVVKSTGSTD